MFMIAHKEETTAWKDLTAKLICVKKQNKIACCEIVLAVIYL